MTSRDVLIALTRQSGPFCRRRYIAVPNVSWGWGLDYEADLIAVSPAGWCTEVEIKVSKADLKADAAKHKWSRGLGPMISRFYYAVPDSLEEFALQNILPNHGLIIVRPDTHSTGFPRARVVRRADRIAAARKTNPDELNKLMHLGIMRFWDAMLKETA